MYSCSCSCTYVCIKVSTVWWENTCMSPWGETWWRTSTLFVNIICSKTFFLFFDWCNFLYSLPRGPLLHVCNCQCFTLYMILRYKSVCPSIHHRDFSICLCTRHWIFRLSIWPSIHCRAFILSLLPRRVLFSGCPSVHPYARVQRFLRYRKNHSIWEKNRIHRILQKTWFLMGKNEIQKMQ